MDWGCPCTQHGCDGSGSPPPSPQRSSAHCQSGQSRASAPPAILYRGSSGRVRPKLPFLRVGVAIEIGIGSAIVARGVQPLFPFPGIAHRVVIVVCGQLQIDILHNRAVVEEQNAGPRLRPRSVVPHGRPARIGGAVPVVRTTDRNGRFVHTEHRVASVTVCGRGPVSPLARGLCHRDGCTVNGVAFLVGNGPRDARSHRKRPCVLRRPVDRKGEALTVVVQDEAGGEAAILPVDINVKVTRIQASKGHSPIRCHAVATADRVGVVVDQHRHLIQDPLP